MKKIVVFSFMFLLLIGLTSCKNSQDETMTYTVTFDTGGGSLIESQEVENGRKVTEPINPEKEGYVFSGDWYNGSFVWNFSVDIVTENVTLTAEWLLVSTVPQNIELTQEAFSSNITWIQSDAADQTFNVYIKLEDSLTYELLQGSISIEEGEVIDAVTFTPDVLPQGGTYFVKVDTGVENAESESLVFGGAGTTENPYMVNDILDILSILDNSELSDKNFLQVADILTTVTDPIEINDDRKIEFNGIYDGGNYVLSFTGNGGFFHEITNSGVVKNLVVADTTQLSASENNLYSIGVIADSNAGLIENVDSRASISNAALQGELPVFTSVDTTNTTTGAGGIVGVNLAEGSIINVSVGGSGSVKAGRGIGGVSAYNYGLIEGANVTATLPAGNQANSGKSSNTYSYGGGITGFNFGTITECVVSGRVFAQSAYSATGDGNEGKNVAFGGIAGYNEGTISNSSFARTMSSKEFIDKTQAEVLGDSVNNLGVASINGDMYVGGIAGINAGSISNVYVGGALISARDYVGGITGLTLNAGSITNSYVFAEIAVKDESGLKITELNDKTTLSTYDIAPSGYDVNTTVYKALINSSTSNQWVPGDLDEPVLPDFTTNDLTILGIAFAENGLLQWQNGVVTGVDITLDSMVIAYGATETIDYSITPSNAPDSMTLWTSSDEAIVEIIGDGMIKGVGAGEAVITVTTRDGGYIDTINVTVEDYVQIDSTSISAGDYVLPETNNSDVRFDIAIGTELTFTVEILPIDADFQNYTITASNSRAEVVEDTVTFVYGSTGPGKVSIVITFEDASVDSLEYRFTTFEDSSNEEDILIASVEITADTLTLPEANNTDDRLEVLIGTQMALTVIILPDDASNQNYTITVSNSRAEVNGQIVTFLYGNTGPGSVTVTLTFEDTTIGTIEYRFTTVESVS